MMNLHQHKAKVRIDYSAKVAAWNRLISNPYSKANENQYLMKVDVFQQSVAELTECFKLYKKRN